MKARHVVWLSAALVFGSLFAGVGLPLLAHAVRTEAKPGTVTVTVNGTGTVDAVPDTATVSYGVTTVAETATAALAQNSAGAAKVIAALKKSGIAAQDIQTQSVSLMPRTNDTGDRILGYTAFNSVTATVRDLANVGASIDAAVASGADTVNGPSLSRADADALYRDALKAALADAHAKAAAIAEAGHLSLGAVQSVSEGSTSPILPVAGKAESPSAPPVEPGTQQIQATLTVTFELV